MKLILLVICLQRLEEKRQEAEVWAMELEKQVYNEIYSQIVHWLDDHTVK
ncbi:hypothetical protein HanHA300_Chr09g0335911 [Helianthus annuus]|nr:hypothetical protein HanHA300_Chr09g0307081 [Helianthus annuus]KAJ0527612.1 hypothetical protein HanHA300_Chr09g0335911 [Helianthus annuus]KAJ0544018.1 hypothetical protein HanHA89_Chr09g0356941 [Helianthus annuus]KAJ0641066.1 hypothetical protein HanLR1_Chr16g0622901 [Helianthus annuus]KAJ0891960.1 hypothetical protein HanPSC8_Chr09g0360211 [Helianthus annuus]